MLQTAETPDHCPCAGPERRVDPKPTSYPHIARAYRARNPISHACCLTPAIPAATPAKGYRYRVVTAGRKHRIILRRIGLPPWQIRTTIMAAPTIQHREKSPEIATG